MSYLLYYIHKVNAAGILIYNPAQFKYSDRADIYNEGQILNEAQI